MSLAPKSSAVEPPLHAAAPQRDPASVRNPQPADPRTRLLALQRTAGNRAVASLLAGGGRPLDPSLRADGEDRVLELAPDNEAEQGMRVPTPKSEDLDTRGEEHPQRQTERPLQEHGRTPIEPAGSDSGGKREVSPLVRATARRGGLDASLDPAARNVMQAWPGFDFSRVRIDTGKEAARRVRALGVAAYAEGETIRFAPDRYAPATEQGRHLLAHELAHVVQQQQGLVLGREFGARAGLEADAEQSARIAVAGGSVHVPTRLGPPATAIQGFDPKYHEQAIIDGLTGIFPPAEIGKMYEANWRRDFSQAPPFIAEIVLVWKELRDKAAVTGKPDRELQWQLLRLLTKLPEDLSTQTYGGYQTWEHMDNPGKDEEKPDATEAEARWAGSGPAGGDIAGYIRDSRASIKDTLASAIGVARGSWGGTAPDSGRTRADAWSRGTPPTHYDMWDPYAGRTRPPQGYGVAKGVSDPAHSSTIVAKEVEAIAASRPGRTAAATNATKGFGADPMVADDLGRASHLIEDFFAHSNFVKLAAQQASGTTIGHELLTTGTFDWHDTPHSIAGKLRNAAADMRANRKLIPLIGDAVIGKLESAANTLEATSKMIRPGPGSHTNLANDSPSPHAPGFSMALALATSADRLVFDLVHRIMQEPSAENADKDIYLLFLLVDAIVTVPSDNHPLKNDYGANRSQEAEERRNREQGAALPQPQPAQPTSAPFLQPPVYVRPQPAFGPEHPLGGLFAPFESPTRQADHVADVFEAQKSELVERAQLLMRKQHENTLDPDDLFGFRSVRDNWIGQLEQAIQMLSKNAAYWQALERLKALKDWLNNDGRNALLRE